MTTLIKNVLLIDGTRQPPVKVDVLVKGEKIAAIGYLGRYKAEKVIDGLGVTYLSPGFIDIHSRSDILFSIFSRPGHDDFLSQGVTTIIGGQGGFSLAPSFHESMDALLPWTNPRLRNKDWHTMQEFLVSVSRMSLGVNFGTLVGYETIRYGLMADEFRDFSQKEMAIFISMVEQAIAGGALGFSLDLQFPFSAHVSSRELRSFADIISHSHSFLSIRPKIIADKKDKSPAVFKEAVAGLVDFAKNSGARILLDDLRCFKKREKDCEDAVSYVNSLATSADVYFSSHLGSTDIVPAFLLLPQWAQRMGTKLFSQKNNLPEIIPRLKKDLSLVNADSIIIFDAFGHDYLKGVSLKKFALESGLSPKDAFISLLSMTKLRTLFVLEQFSSKAFDSMVASDRMVLASFLPSCGSSSIDLCGNYPFSEYLAYAFSHPSIPIETFIRKITSTPARILGLSDRGILRENFWADLVLFKSGKVEHVFVNGEHVLDSGSITGKNSGRAIIRG